MVPNNHEVNEELGLLIPFYNIALNWSYVNQFMNQKERIYEELAIIGVIDERDDYDPNESKSVSFLKTMGETEVANKLEMIDELIRCKEQYDTLKGLYDETKKFIDSINNPTIKAHRFDFAAELLMAQVCCIETIQIFSQKNLNPKDLKKTIDKINVTIEKSNELNIIFEHLEFIDNKDNNVPPFVYEDLDNAISKFIDEDETVKKLTPHGR